MFYDSETGYYYLQSRYYDPTICRFINADLPEYASEKKNETVGINIFVYCCNDAVNNSDPNGCKKKSKIPEAKKIGWGIQIELSAAFAITSITVGVELIWFKPPYHNGNKNSPYVFLYYGGNIGAAGGESSITDFVDKCIKNLFNYSPTSVKNISNVFSFSISACAFVIYGFKKNKNGYKKFEKAEHYKGPFSVVSGTLLHIKFYAALGEYCYAFGAGIDSSKLSVSWGCCNYYLLKYPKQTLRKLKKSAKKNAV